MVEVFFRTNISEEYKGYLLHEYKRYYDSLDIKKPNRLVELPLAEYVGTGFTPYSNPYYEFTQNGKMLDFWSAKLIHDDLEVRCHIRVLYAFGKWDELEKLRDYVQNILNKRP